MTAAAKEVFIYTLADPRDEVVRYVGYSANPKTRLRGHLRDTNQCHRVHWIQELVSAGVKPAVEIIEKCLPGEDFKTKEIEWIAAYRAIGFDLVNDTNGGEGLANPSAETRDKIGAGNRGKKQSSETIAKKSAALVGNKNTLGRKQPAEERARHSAAMKGNKNTLGRKHTPEHNANISISVKKALAFPEVREKISTGLIGNQNFLGHTHTPETRNKIGETGRMTAAIPETRVKRSTAQMGNKNALGFKHTLEVKEEIGVKSRAVWALRRVKKQMTALVNMVRQERDNDGD